MTWDSHSQTWRIVEVSDLVGWSIASADADGLNPGFVRLTVRRIDDRNECRVVITRMTVR